MRSLVLALAASACLLAGCETTAEPPVGVSVLPIEANRVQVTYRGRSGMSQPEVEDHALVQAAQLTLDRGGDWFRIAGRSGGMASPTGPQFSFGVGGLSFGRHSAVGGGVGTTVGGEGTFVSSLEVEIGRGPKPADPSVYDARDVITTVGGRLR